MWKDPYENWLAKSNYKLGNTKISYSAFIECFYGQCWSALKESDGLWQLYSKDFRGVKIRTSISKLKKLKNSEINSEPYTTQQRVDSIKYLNSEAVEEWVEKRKNTNCLINRTDLRDSLFIKRPQCQDEKEVRVVFDKSQKEHQAAPKFLAFFIDPNHFIEEIVFDPRMIKDNFYIQKNCLETLGYTGSIEQSDLYTFTPIEINLS